MEIKNLKDKIKIKKGLGILQIFVGMLIAIFVVVGLYNFVHENELQAEIVPDAKFTNAVNSLQGSQGQLNNISQTFQNLSLAVKEGDVNDAGYYGFKGMLALMKTPFSLVNIATDMFSAVRDTSDLIPTSVTTIIILIMVFVVIFAGITFLSNRGKDST